VQIAEAIKKTTITPRYEIKSVGKKGNYEDINIDVYIYAWGGSFNLTVEHSYKDGTYYTVFLGRSHEEKSLQNFILWWVKDSISVDSWVYNLNDLNRLERAEKVVEQFRKYGMEKWYYIEY
jgi:hypothetical protein